jgi:hypothetical protein
MQSPHDAKEFLARAKIFRQLASKRKPNDVREGNFYKYNVWKSEQNFAAIR